MSWTTGPLGDVTQLVAMGPFGSSIKKERYVDSGIPVINGKHLHSTRLNDSAGYEYITEAHADDLRRSNAYRGDVVVTHRGTLGQVSVIPDGSAYDRYVVSQSQLLIRPDSTRLDGSFLAYYLRGPVGQRDLLAFATQTGVPALAQPTTSVRALVVNVPPLAEQQAIAEVLGALDDKIAANASLVEAVDALLASSFESRFGDSKHAALESIATVNAIKSRPLAGETLRYLDISSVGVGRHDVPPPITWADAPGRARRGIRAGDTVWSTVRPNRRSHALVLDDAGPLIGSTGLAVLTPVQSGPAFLYEATRRPAFTTYLETVAEGSAYPAVRAERFAAAPVPDVFPSSRTEFEEFAMPLRERQHAAHAESRTLAALRDALLPELMSGRLQVRDAERTVEEAI